MPRRIVRSVWGLLFVLACAPSQGQDLLQIWQAALQRDPLYAGAQAGRDADQEIKAQARALVRPQIALSGGGEVKDQRYARTMGYANTQTSGLWALTLTQPIYDPARWNTLRQSEYIAESADLELRQAYQDLILRVARAYFDVLAAQDTLKTLLAQKAAVTTQLEAAEKGFELGSTTIADKHEAQARLDLISASELQARNTLQISEDQLAKIINERPGKLAVLATNLTLPPPQPNRMDMWIAQAEQSNLATARAQLATRIVEKQLDIARDGHSPTLSLYARTGSASTQGVDGLRNGPRSVDTAVGLQLSIPIYSGGGISSQVREQTSRLQQARYNYEAARRQAVQAAQQYYAGVVSGLAQVEALRAAEKSSLASLQANRTGYEIGVRVNIDVLNAQQQLYETQRALSRARYDTLLNALQLKYASGSLSEADLEAINRLLVPAPAEQP